MHALRAGTAPSTACCVEPIEVGHRIHATQYRKRHTLCVAQRPIFCHMLTIASGSPGNSGTATPPICSNDWVQ